MTTVDFTSRPDMPMACARCVLRGGDHVGQRDLDAEINHPITIIGQDDVDEVFPDVMHIPPFTVARTMVPFS